MSRPRRPARVYLLAAAIGCVPVAGRAASQDFIVLNRTGYQIDSVYVAEAGSQQWGNDVLGRDKLDPGERADVSFDRGTRDCTWTLMVKYHDDTRAIWPGINLCETSRVVLFFDARTGSTFARME